MSERRPRRPTRLPVMLALAALLLLAPAPLARRSAAAPQGVGELYLALGDSLGVGLLASMPDTRGYVPLLHGLLERGAGRGVQLRNLSVSGETARSFVTGGQLVAAQGALAEARRAGWRVSPITIDLGGNDLRALRGADDAAREAGLAQYRADMGQILDALIAATTTNGARRGDIVTMTIYDPVGGDPQLVHSDAWWIARFNGALAEEATRRGVAVAPVAARFAGQERTLTWMPLDFHPNNAGHRAIAEALWGTTGYDTTPPELQIVAPGAGALPRPVPTIKVRASDALGVTRVILRLDDRPLPDPVFARDLDLWVGYWDARAATVGQHRLTISASDAAGNTTTQEVLLDR
jgi:lysophospholipase L1-like esterase